ncbi:MAG TPA: TetR/AcrR family transcriptional regulator [Nakamurella sp.]|nr:TetR/AcrR family transcriptional regulator [Nakamurella sp.]
MRSDAPSLATATTAPDGGLRERKKDATRRALAERAMQLAVRHGYHGFTIADLVADVGVSRRTFSNYFASKADCIAAVTEGWLDDVLDAIRRAPVPASLAEVMQSGLMAVARQGTERWGALQPLIDAEPEIAAQILAGDDAVIDLVAGEVAARTGLDTDDIRVRLLAAFAVTAGREVLRRWASTGKAGGDVALAGLLESAFSIIDVSRLTGTPRT